MGNIQSLPREISQRTFVDIENKSEILNAMSHTVKRVLDCITSSENAIINPEITTEEVKKHFPLEAFPEEGCSEDHLDLILEKAKVINFGSPNFFGQMHPSRKTEAIIAATVSTILNQNLIAEEVSQSFTQMENQTVGFLADLIGYDINKAGGSIVSGGTTANHTAMLVARNTVLGNFGEDENGDLIDGVAEVGVHDALKTYNEINNTEYEDVVVYIGEDNHYSIDKLASYTGIGSKKFVRIPYEKGTHHLDINYLEKSIEQSENEKKLVVGVFITAGTTEKGHVHNIEDTLSITKGVGQAGREIYTHIDAAHGGGFLVLDEMKNDMFTGIDQADSVTMDGHKMFYTNYSCGGIIFKDKRMMNCIKQSAKYIMDEESLNENHGMYTLEGSRGTAGLYQLWASIKAIGRKGYEDILRTSLENTDILHDILEADSDFEILSGEPTLNIICFRFKPNDIQDDEVLNEIHDQVRDQMLNEGIYYVGETTIDDQKCFKAIFINKETGRKNIEGFINKVKEIYGNISI